MCKITLTYGDHACPTREEKLRKLKVFWVRSMVKGWLKRKNVHEGGYIFQFTNQEIKFKKGSSAKSHACTIPKTNLTCM